VFGYYICGAFVAAMGICFAAPGANIAGYTKRVTVSGMVFVAYATGNIIGTSSAR
jgi:ACS family allantoate permease-like MFS transporter